MSYFLTLSYGFLLSCPSARLSLFTNHLTPECPSSRGQTRVKSPHLLISVEAASCEALLVEFINLSQFCSVKSVSLLQDLFVVAVIDNLVPVCCLDVKLCLCVAFISITRASLCSSHFIILILSALAASVASLQR